MKFIAEGIKAVGCWKGNLHRNFRAEKVSDPMRMDSPGEF